MGQVLHGSARTTEAVRRGCTALAFALHGFLAVCAAPARAADVEIHYAPGENLERMDVGLLRSAHTKIDMAAYSLTDWPVIGALIDARRRGVVLRIVLDPSQQHALDRLREIAGSIRIKAPGPYMHLKSYSVDGRILRSGSANLSASGLKQQDNDLIILREPPAARAFEARFEQLWAGANPLPAPGNQFANPERAPAQRTETAAPAVCLIKGNISRSGGASITCRGIARMSACGWTRAGASAGSAPRSRRSLPGGGKH